MKWKKTVVPLMAATALAMTLPLAPAPLSGTFVQEVSASAQNTLISYEVKSGEKAIDGAEISFYKIADIRRDSNGHESIVPLEPYRQILKGKSREDLTENAQDFARELIRIPAVTDISRTTNPDGIAEFKAVPDGCYLVTEKGRSGTALSYKSAEPTVIVLPQLEEDGSANRNIQPALKVRPASSPESSSESPASSSTASVSSDTSVPESGESSTDSHNHSGTSSSSGQSGTTKPSDHGDHSGKGGKSTQYIPDKPNQVSPAGSSSSKAGKASSNHHAQKKTVLARIISGVKTGDSRTCVLLVGIMILSISVVILTVRKQNIKREEDGQ